MTPTETPAVTSDALRVESLHDGQLWRVFLNKPKGNVLDGEMIGALHALFERARETRELKLVTLEGEGRHFSFGASVEEHRPESCADMLRGLHAMLRALDDSGVACHALVRGQCLGGGLELAAFCHRLWADESAVFGQPEIVLGVFAPVASAILPGRCGRGAAEDLCLSGRSIGAAEAHRIGLADALVQDVWEAALADFDTHYAPRSASSLRFAVRAIRADFRRSFDERIEALERLYLDELMKSRDAVEGLAAFLEKRQPQWRNE